MIILTSGDVSMTSPPEYLVTNVKVVEDRGEYVRLEFGTLEGPVIVTLSRAAYRELVRRVMGEDEP
jgi:hypothetical protein